jgi:hypothetical protein
LPPHSIAPKTMVLRFPPCLPTGAHPLYTLLRRGRLFLVGCCVSRCRSAAVQRQRCILYIFFHRLNSSPQTIGRRHPIHSNPHAPPLQHLSYRGRQLFDCCIFQLNGGHLRPRHHFPSIFFIFLLAEPGRGRRWGEGEVPSMAASRVGARRGVVLRDCRLQQSQRIIKRSVR